MNRTSLSCLAAVALAGATGVAFHTVASASSHEYCFGLNAGRVCVEPRTSNLPSVHPSARSIEECAHVGPTCVPVTAPVPSASAGTEPPAGVQCYMDNVTCEQRIRELTDPH